MWFRAWTWQARLRRNAQRALRPLGPVDDLVTRFAPGRSFVDVGAMWDVHGRIAFLAEDHGATAVTAVDVSTETDEYRDEHGRRGSSVRFVRGDLHHPATIDSVGPHQVVWCSGVVYHVPNPLVTLDCLRKLTSETLVLISATIPEVPGVEQASVFFPHLSEGARRGYDRVYDATLSHPGERAALTTPFDLERSYANWWWGMTPSALGGMLRASGFRVDETQTNGFHTRIVASVA